LNTIDHWAPLQVALWFQSLLSTQCKLSSLADLLHHFCAKTRIRTRKFVRAPSAKRPLFHTKLKLTACVVTSASSNWIFRC